MHVDDASWKEQSPSTLHDIIRSCEQTAIFNKWTIFVLFGSKDHQSKPAQPSSASDAHAAAPPTNCAGATDVPTNGGESFFVLSTDMSVFEMTMTWIVPYKSLKS